MQKVEEGKCNSKTTYHLSIETGGYWISSVLWNSGEDKLSKWSGSNASHSIWVNNTAFEACMSYILTAISNTSSISKSDKVDDSEQCGSFPEE